MFAVGKKARENNRIVGDILTVSLRRQVLDRLEVKVQPGVVGKMKKKFIC